MLVLSRIKDQSVIIDGGIEVIVVEVRGERVRLGFNAPRDVTIHRKEIYEAIHKEKRAKPDKPQCEIADLTWIHEDRLHELDEPPTNEQYSELYQSSRVIDAVRVFPAVRVAGKTHLLLTDRTA